MNVVLVVPVFAAGVVVGAFGGRLIHAVRKVLAHLYLGRLANGGFVYDSGQGYTVGTHTVEQQHVILPPPVVIARPAVEPVAVASHAAVCNCLTCLLRREHEFCQRIAEWNEVASSIPTARWQPINYPETRQ